MKRLQFLYTVPLLVLLFALSLVSCRDAIFDYSHPDPSDPSQSEVSAGDYFEATVSFSSTDLKVPSLRALDKAGENEIKTENVKAYVFQSIGTSSTFLYDAEVTKVEPDADKANAEGKITLLIKDSGDQLVKVFFVVNATPSKVPTVGTTLEEFQKLFVFNQKDLWGAGELPMYAESQAVKISHSSGAVPPLQKEPIPFLRAVARVDVMLGAKSGEKFDEITTGLKTKGGQDLKITSIKAFNVADKGYAIPLQANVENATTAPKVNATSLPEGLTKKSTPTSYLADDTGVDAQMRTIYIPELNNTPHKPTPQDDGQNKPEEDQTNYLARPYLILGIKGAVEGDASKVTYFRVDYLKRRGVEATATYEYLDILRNYRYMVNITNIGGPGFDNEEDAKEGPAANIMYNVLVWEESKMTNVMYDGQYMLGVSQDEIQFFKEAGELVSIKVQTSWKDGFEVKNLPDWIELADIKPAKEGANTNIDEKIVTFRVKTSTDVERNWLNTKDHEGAYIQAGRMRWNLSFTQKNTLNVDIAIFSDPECTKPLQYIALDERGKATPKNEYTVGSKKFYVKVTPAARISEVTDETKTAFIFSSNGSTGSDQVPISSAKQVSPGVFEFEVTAEQLSNPKDPFETKQNTYHFITEQYGLRDQADLTINQTEYNIIFYEDAELTKRFEGDLEGFYSMDGGLKSIYVKSNIPYDVWLDNQMIDESVRTATNSTEVGGVKGYSTKPIVTHWVKQGTSQEVPVDYTPAKWYKVKHEATSTPNGSEIKFRVQGDPTNLEILYGHVKWVAGTPLPSMQWKFPLFDGTNHKDVSMASCAMIAAKEIPEANSFQVTLGRIGVLIPLSRINHAADFYEQNFDSPYQFTATDYSNDKDKTAKLSTSENWDSYKKRNMLNRLDKDDKIELEVLWTDIKSVTEKSSEADRNPIKADGSAPLRALSEITIRDERYAFVLFGDNNPDNSGNLVFCVRSPDKSRVNNNRGELLDLQEQGKDPILWSFHLMIYEQGKIPKYTPTVDVTSNQKVTQYRKDDEHNKIWPREIYSLPYDLGAFEMPVRYQNNEYRYSDYQYRRVGLTYQYGRKDPFPRWKNPDNRPTRLVGHQGKVVNFTLRYGYTISLRESIEFPMVMAGNTDGHQWLTEGGKTTATNISLAGTSAFGAYGLWGGGSPVGNESTASQRVNLTRMTNKTVFDPCPYGFCIPTPGYSSTYALLNETNRARIKWNFVVWIPSSGFLKYVNLFTSQNNPDDLFSINKDNRPLAIVGQTMLAVSTSYIAQSHYPVILMTYGTGALNERYQKDVHRSSPICVRPFNYTPESDWMQYLQF